jgi:hypothetical protein
VSDRREDDHDDRRQGFDDGELADSAGGRDVRRHALYSSRRRRA